MIDLHKISPTDCRKLFAVVPLTNVGIKTIRENIEKLKIAYFFFGSIKKCSNMVPVSLDSTIMANSASNL